MFGKLFAESGLSLDRLRALVELGASGSIVRAAPGDPARQSQYSRQIKELEDFFQITLVERHGKNLRLTANGKELARISRFFLLGLSNFQRGCLAEGQTYRFGAGATFNQVFLLPLLGNRATARSEIHFTVETLSEDEVERRLHDLTLDFGVVTRKELSRPLQLKELGKWRLKLWAPKSLHANSRTLARALREGQLPFVWPASELDLASMPGWQECEPDLVCASFLDARAALEGNSLAALLPDFLGPVTHLEKYICVADPMARPALFRHSLAWNPRLMRLNPHTARRRDALAEGIARSMCRA